MTMPILDLDRTVILKDDVRDDPSLSADACLRAAHLARSIADYAPQPWRERREDRMEMSAGDDARIAWIQDVATRGRAGPAWRTRLQMWEPMPCGDSLRTLQITLPDGIAPDTLRPEGMRDLAALLTALSSGCRSALDADPMPWLAHAVAAHARRPFEGGAMMPECGWLPHGFEGDVADAIPDAARTMLGRTVPPMILLSTSVQETEEGMDMHEIAIRPVRIAIGAVDPITGLRALERFDEMRRRAG